MVTISSGNIFKCIFMNEKFCILIQIPLFVPKGAINNNPALVQIMALHRTGDKPFAEQATSHYLRQCWPSSLMHICGTRGRWVNYTTGSFNNKMDFINIFLFCESGIILIIWYFSWNQISQRNYYILINSPQATTAADINKVPSWNKVKLYQSGNNRTIHQSKHEGSLTGPIVKVHLHLKSPVMTFVRLFNSPIAQNCLPLGLCKGTVSSFWKTVKILTNDVIPKYIAITQNSVDLRCFPSISKLTNHIACSISQLDAMSHTPPTVLGPPSLECVAVYDLHTILHQLPEYDHNWHSDWYGWFHKENIE